MLRGKLTLIVNAGRNLLAKDFGGTSDPFCVLEILDQGGKPIKKHTKQTSVIKKTLFPTWGEKFNFKLDEECYDIRISCFDYDHLSNDLIGINTISSASLGEEAALNDWFLLKDKKGKEAGEIQLDISFMSEEVLLSKFTNPAEMDEITKEFYNEKQKSALGASQDTTEENLGEIRLITKLTPPTELDPNGRLNLTVFEARKLKSMDKNGLSDPFVRVEIGNFKKKTDVKKKTLNPVFQDQFEIPVDKVAMTKPLVVTVFDWDPGLNTNDFMGCVIFNLNDFLIDHPPKTLVDKWYLLSSNRKKDKKGQGRSRKVTRAKPTIQRDILRGDDLVVSDWTTDVTYRDSMNYYLPALFKRRGRGELVSVLQNSPYNKQIKSQKLIRKCGPLIIITIALVVLLLFEIY